MCTSKISTIHRSTRSWKKLWKHRKRSMMQNLPSKRPSCTKVLDEQKEGRLDPDSCIPELESKRRRSRGACGDCSRRG
ncbi:hypothetical protein MTO96_038047 [Rhipicephalus appendiculatus]